MQIIVRIQILILENYYGVCRSAKGYFSPRIELDPLLCLFLWQRAIFLDKRFFLHSSQMRSCIRSPRENELFSCLPDPMPSPLHLRNIVSLSSDVGSTARYDKTSLIYRDNEEKPDNFGVIYIYQVIY